MADGLVACRGCLGRTQGNVGPRRPAPPPALCMHIGSAVASRFPRLDVAQRGASGKRKGIRRVRCVAQPLRKEIVTPPQQSDPTEYHDSWLEAKAIEFLTERIGFLSGKTTEFKGYDGFVDMTRKLVSGLPAKNQRDMIRDLLHLVLPNWLLFMFRMVPKTKPMKEFYAQFTMVFFRWLVGNCEIREAEIDGVLMKSTVHIKKCRYLENSQCVGLCVNLCKNPTQEFIGKQFGMPLTMNPNFEDYSCDMIYGLHPPSTEEDPAYQQPCYSLCKTAKKKPNCSEG